MILVTGAIVASAATFDEVLQLSNAHVERSRAEPGCISHAVFRDTSNPWRLVFFEQWADAAALKAHFVVPASRAFAKAVGALAAELPTLQIYNAEIVEPRQAVMTPVVRRLLPSDAPAYRALMLDGYARHPEAFTSSVAERAALPMGWWEGRLSVEPAAREIVIGAFEGDALAGVAGLSFETREKARHKADFFGMYVAPAFRRLGLGGLIVGAAIDAARERDGVRLLQLTVTEGNASAQSLYERFGFVTFGLEPMAVAVDGAFVSKVHMWLLLSK